MKDTLCSSGANATLKHIEKVSLSALFLADAAKKADRELGLPTYSGKHTAHDAQRNINQIARHLQNYQVPRRFLKEPLLFKDLTYDGWKKLDGSWLERVLGLYPLTEVKREKLIPIMNFMMCNYVVLTRTGHLCTYSVNNN